MIVVDWGDSNTDIITTWNQAETLHTYASSGDYTITIKGTINGWSFDQLGDVRKILEITKWGDLKLSSTSVSSFTPGYFRGCSNLVLTSVSDVLDLSNTTNLISMFDGCSSITTINNIESWNVS